MVNTTAAGSPASEPVRDYLAIIYIGGGSSYARGPDKEKVIRSCAEICHSDWSSLFDLNGHEIPVNVFDVTGYDEITWGFHGVQSGDHSFDLLETRTVKLPEKRKSEINPCK